MLALATRDGQTMKVLLVDDDVELAEMLRDYLEREGFAVATAHDGETGALEALTDRYDMVVLDVMMPRMDGIEALTRIRMHSAVPVLMLTAKGDDLDRITGLELGADDYVAKPCTPRELVARIRAILRRAHPAEPDSGEPDRLTAGPLTLYPFTRSAQWNGQPLNLTSTEFSLLEVLARQAGRAVAKDELSQQGLGRPLSRFDRSVDMHVSSLRQKLGCLPDGRSYILTVRGKGYQLVRE
jgi:two-component system, OmpR family, response regulator